MWHSPVPWEISTGCFSLWFGSNWVPIWHRIWASGLIWPIVCQCLVRPPFSASSASVWWPWPSRVCSLSRGDRGLTPLPQPMVPAKIATRLTLEKSRHVLLSVACHNALPISSSQIVFDFVLGKKGKEKNFIMMNSKYSSDHLSVAFVCLYYYVDSILTTTITNLLQIVCCVRAFCFNDDNVGAY